jgi:hypothetical protein
MKKKMFSSKAFILSLMAVLIFYLIGRVGHHTDNTAIAAPQVESPAAFTPVHSLSIASGVATTMNVASTNNLASMGWLIECVDCPKYFYKMTDRSLRLDATGYPHIAYGDDHLYYAWYDGANWHVETADKAPGVGKHASLALDEGGNPHISYFDDDNDALKYAYHDASGWHTQIVNDAWDGNLEGGTSLALDGSGYPHISYYDDS